ncbi:MAG: patatin-like phospholipase family protein [Burkholderiaceae bacterium]
MSAVQAIQPELNPPEPTVKALVLMGGGARTAYQVGVLQALAAMFKLQPQLSRNFPFQILAGTSAGAINAAYLAGHAELGIDAFAHLASFWTGLRSRDIYRLNVSPLVGISKLFAAWSLVRQARRHGAILDSMPLVDTLHHCIALNGIESALQSNTIKALAVTASSYTSGVHWTFCHTSHDSPLSAWSLPGRRAEFQPLTIEHLMASAAIPFLFPATPLWVDGHREFFGDGAMRQTSPLAPAMQLRANKLLVVGVGQPGNSALPGHSVGENAMPPSLASIAGHTMDSIFHDSLQANVEQAQRVSQTLNLMSRHEASPLPHRKVDVLAIQPSQSLDILALAHVRELPRITRSALNSLGLLRGSGALASYLLFEPGFIQALIALGEHDAYARKEELLTFFEGS